MKKLTGLFFAVVMMFSIVFISEAISTENSPFAASAQQRVRVKRKKGVVRRGYAGGKYVARKTWSGTKYVGRKSVQGTRYVGRKTVKGAKYTYKGGRKIVSRTKKVVY